MQSPAWLLSFVRARINCMERCARRWGLFVSLSALFGLLVYIAVFSFHSSSEARQAAMDNSRRFDEIVANQRIIVANEHQIIGYFELSRLQAKQQMDLERQIFGQNAQELTNQDWFRDIHEREDADLAKLIAASADHDKLMRECVSLWEQHTHQSAPKP